MTQRDRLAMMSWYLLLAFAGRGAWAAAAGFSDGFDFYLERKGNTV